MREHATVGVMLGGLGLCGAACLLVPAAGVVRHAAAKADGGYGKTIAALLYAHARAVDYPGGRFLVRCEGGDITGEMERVGDRLGITGVMKDDERAQRAATVLSEGPPCLLILDNVVDERSWEAIRGCGLLPDGEARVLVTTQRPNLPGVTVSPARAVVDHLVALDLLRPSSQDERILSAHRAHRARLEKRLKESCKDKDIDERNDALEVHVYSIEGAWSDSSPTDLAWEEVVALHQLGEQMVKDGRSTAAIAARSAVRRVFPSLPPPHPGILDAVAAVAQAIGMRVQ